MYKLAIRNESEIPTADIYIYSSIEHELEGYISARALHEELSNQVYDKVILHVNSEGGDLLEAFAIYDMLRGIESRGHEVTALIEGICGSSASAIVMACSKIIMQTNSYMMIHEPVISLTGTSEELAMSSEFLNDVREKLIKIYIDRTLMTREVIEGLMKKESWLNAESCKIFGLCDEIACSASKAESVTVQRTARYMDSATLSVSNRYRTEDKTKTVIQNMARVINERRNAVN